MSLSNIILYCFDTAGWSTYVAIKSFPKWTIMCRVER